MGYRFLLFGDPLRTPSMLSSAIGLLHVEARVVRSSHTDEDAVLLIVDEVGTIPARDVPVPMV